MTIILAKILGMYFLAIGIAFLFNPDRFRKICQQLVKDENFLFFGGMLALLIGAFVISVHNVWILDWPVIITILGWWSLVKGFAILTYPSTIDFFSFFQSRSNGFYRAISLIYLILGLFFIYKSWW